MKGKVLAGRFRLTEMLGQGGMGSVWRAQHLELGTEVAVKLMDPSLAANPEGLARFRREAQAAASLKSPNVVQVFDYGVDGDTPYIAMEVLKGESLASRIERLRRLDPLDAAAILSQVARALGKAHDAGIVHRDLKPENIFLVKDEDIEIAKVLDFGIAKQTGLESMMGDALQTQTGTMLGTPYYMSPEQAAGKKGLDHRTDIWSFGIIACECLTGRRIFEAETFGGLILAICTESPPPPSQLGPVPPKFDAWCACCLARDRESRFHSIREAAAALESVCREGAIGQSRGPASSEAVVAATTAPAAWLESTVGLSSSTQTGPTSLTVNRVKSPNQRRLIGFGLVALVLLFGAGAYLRFGNTAPAVLPVSSAAAAPSLEANLPAQVDAPRAKEVVPVVTPAPVASSTTPSEKTPAAPARVVNKPASMELSAKNLPRSAAAPAHPAVPAPAPTPGPARAPARPNPVDLAF